MTDKPRLLYFGWSCFSVETSQGVLLFDPFFRPECGAEWSIDSVLHWQLMMRPTLTGGRSMH
jgi:L-ascorbate metabolism protein UlaG (beta-lactamase superfamily)